MVNLKKIFFIIVLILTFSFLIKHYAMDYLTNPDLFRETAISLGIFGPFIIILAMIFQAIITPIPASAIAIVSGGLYGAYWGYVYAASGALIGASLCFFISKKFGKGWVEKKFSRKEIEKIDDKIERYGFYAILIARLIPLISFDLVSYAAGLTGMGFRNFFLATLIGMIPGTFFYTYLGAISSSLEFFGLFITLVILISVFFYLKK